MTSFDAKSAKNIPIIQESVVDFWESIPRDWPKHKYDVALVEDLDRLLQDYARKSQTQVRRVLDCGCGTGNPSIGLAKKGYDMFCVDADPNMVARFKQNCDEVDVEIPVITYDWRDLNGKLLENGPFDAAICRGNSLIYAGCWDRPSFIPGVAARAIETALKHISAVIRPNGLFYVDITSTKEYADDTPKFEFVGRRQTDTHDVIIYWINEYDRSTRTRRVHGRRIFETNDGNVPEHITTYTFAGYMLYHDELVSMANLCGLTHMKEASAPTSEWLYDVFQFRKGGQE